jgi:hypothetical protein
MTTKTILIFTLIVTSISSFAQNSHIGFIGGARLNNIATNITNVEPHSQAGWLGGIAYQYNFSEHYSFGTDLVFYKTGFALKQDIVDEAGNLRTKQHIPFIYYYTGLPLKLGYTSGEKFFWSTKIGMCPSLLISAKYLIPGSKDAYFPNGEPVYHNYITNEIKQFDVSGLLEVGGGIKVGNRARFFVNAIAMMSLTNHSTDTFFSARIKQQLGAHFSDGKMQHSSLGINIGFDFLLGKE